MSRRLLLVEDEPRIAAFLVRGLEAEGWAVTHAADAAAARAATAAEAFPLIVLDRMLPDGDGLEVCRELRATGCASLILILTAKDGLPDKLDGLRGGADDYLTKPFAFDELLARLDTLLRRERPGSVGNVLTAGDLRLDRALKAAWRADRRIPLTAREFALLAHLMQHAGRVVDRTQLLRDVWGLAFDPGTKVVDVYVRYLRLKLGDPAGEVVRTVRGFGYTIDG